MAESEEQQENGQGVRRGSVGKDLKVEEGGENQTPPAEEEVSLVGQKEQEVIREEEQMEVTEEGQSGKERPENVEEKKMEEEEEGETAMDQSENPTSQIPHQHQNVDLIRTPEAPQDSDTEPKPVPAPVQTSIPVPGPVPEVSVQTQRLPDSHRDLQPVPQEDFCENMSTKSDNQSGTFRRTPSAFPLTAPPSKCD